MFFLQATARATCQRVEREGHLQDAAFNVSRWRSARQDEDVPGTLGHRGGRDHFEARGTDMTSAGQTGWRGTQEVKDTTEWAADNDAWTEQAALLCSALLCSALLAS